MLLSSFLASLVSYGNQLCQSAGRLSHVGDAAILLLPAGYRMSRYTYVPTGAALTAASAALAGITSPGTGTTAQIAAAVTALEVADEINVTAVQTAGVALLTATALTVTPLTRTYVAAIAAAAPADAVSILFALAASVANDGTAFPVMLGVQVLAVVAQAILDYTPQSSTETLSILTNYINLFDATVAPASNLGWAATVAALNVLRAAVLAYLQQALSVAPAVLTQNFDEPLPDVVAAYAIYGDATKAESLVTINNPVNPLQLPTAVSYLNA